MNKRIILSAIAVTVLGSAAVLAQGQVPAHPMTFFVAREVPGTGNLGGLGTEGGTSAPQEDNNHDAPNAGVGIGGKPPETRSGVGTGSRLAQYLFLIEVYAQTTRSAVLHGARHAIRNFGDHCSDVEVALHARLEIRHFIRASRVLEIIKSAVIGNCGNKRAKLQGSHRNPFAEGTHFAHAAKLRVDFRFGISAKLFIRNVIACQLT